jgi:hypothetical protein
MYKDHRKRWSFFLLTTTAVKIKEFMEQKLVLLFGNSGDAPLKCIAGIELIKYSKKNLAASLANIGVLANM